MSIEVKPDAKCDLTLEQALKTFAQQLGFDDAGIASVDGHLPFAQEVKSAYQQGRFGPLDYLERTLNVRLDIKQAFPEAQSVVVVTKNYYTGDHPRDGVSRAKIARYAWGKDYHQWFKKQLRAFKPFLQEKIGTDIEIWPFNDTRPVLERAWAFKAGMGFIGKSGMFIHRSLGTWTLLGGFATSLRLEEDRPYDGPHCGTCTRCIDACPTNAIVDNHQVDANKCISTWTIERPLHKSAIDAAPRQHTWGFGCDICQEVCPWNKFQKVTFEERFLPIPGRMFLDRDTFEQDLRGSPLHRSTKAGLLANYLRIQRSLSNNNLKIMVGRKKPALNS